MSLTLNKNHMKRETDVGWENRSTFFEGLSSQESPLAPALQEPNSWSNWRPNIGRLLGGLPVIVAP